MMKTQASLSLRQYDASHGSHAHEHFQVLLGLDGVLELEVRGRGRRIGAGEGWVIEPGERHDFESAAGSRCLVLDTSQAVWAQCGAAPARPRQALALAHYLAVALSESSSLAAQYGPQLLADAWMEPAAARRVRRRIDWPALSAWAQARWQQPLTVADLAARARLSPSQFATRCREETGASAMQWLRSQRLAQAQQLRAGGLGVAETARRTGYRSPSALTAALRREFPLS